MTSLEKNKRKHDLEVCADILGNVNKNLRLAASQLDMMIGTVTETNRLADSWIKLWRKVDGKNLGDYGNNDDDIRNHNSNNNGSESDSKNTGKRKKNHHTVNNSRSTTSSSTRSLSIRNKRLKR